MSGAARAGQRARSRARRRRGARSRSGSSRGSSRCRRPRAHRRALDRARRGTPSAPARGSSAAARSASAGARSRPASSARAGAIAATRSGAGHLEDVVTWSALIAAMLRFATPLMFGALGGIVSERSGVVNIGIEGMMLMGCYFGIYGADVARLVGRSASLVAMVAGGALALVHAVFSVTLRADQIVGGVAINLLALGITGYLFVDHYGDQGTPDDISRVPDVTLPLIKDIPFVGDAIGKHEPADVAGDPARHRAGGVPVPHPAGPAPALGRRAPARGRDRRPRRSSARAISPSSPPACSRRSAARTCRSASSARSTRT